MYFSVQFIFLYASSSFVYSHLTHILHSPFFVPEPLNNLCLTSCFQYIEPCSLFISLHLLGSILLLVSKVTLYFHFCSKCCYTLSCPIYPLSFGRILTKSSHPSVKMTFVSSLHLCLLSIFSLVMFLSCWLYQMYLNLSLNLGNNNILYFNILHSINILLQVTEFCA
jgi:hypothetical protein